MANYQHVYPRIVRPVPEPLGLYFRIGRNDHRAVLNQIAAGDFACFGAVFDPVYAGRHKELLDQVLNHRLDAILDPKTQPAATPGGYNEAIGKLPWGIGRPHTPMDFAGTSGRRLITALGDFVLKNGFTQVLAPTHALRSAHDEWLEIDLEATRRLRDYLDRNNGSQVQIIYSLTITYAMLRNPDQRHHVIEMLQGIPATAVWLKVDGFGSRSTPTGTRSYIEAAPDFCDIGLPLVADHVGGLVGLSLLAFGATGGLVHGITQWEGFDSGNWRRPRTGDGFSSHYRIYLPQIDMHLKPADARRIFEALPRAKALLGCRDNNCCQRGLIDMLQSPARHFLYQRIHAVSALSQVPEQLRARQFLDQHLLPATDLALRVANISWDDEAMKKRTHEQRKRLDALRLVLGAYETKHQKRPPVYLPKTRVSRETRLSVR